MENNILIIDDDVHILNSFSITLKSFGIKNVFSCNDSRKADYFFENHNINILLLDLTMPHMSGEDILENLIKNHPEISTIIISGISDVETAIRCIKKGAVDYILKPVTKNDLIIRISKIIEFNKLKHENQELTKYYLNTTLYEENNFFGILSQNKKMQALFQYIKLIAQNNFPVLITGETGVGKELFAKAIHSQSQCKGKFIPVNLAGVDDQFFSDTLFGHKAGSFTGATQNRSGLVEQAKNGILFLDEIGDLTEKSQVKLLRFLQEKKYQPIGSDLYFKSNARIVAATHKNLDSLDFRKDLFYRLSSYHISIPPLRDRKDDLPILVDNFFNVFSKQLNKKKPYYTKELIDLLKTYSFPGNIRELESMILKSITIHKSKTISLTSLKDYINSKGGIQNDILKEEKNFLFPESLPTIKTMTDLLIKEALKRSSGNQSIAANLLGISQQALNKRLNKKF